MGDAPVAIIGAGVAGLRVAKLLQDREVPYQIFEASARHGGRCFTYHFTPDLPHDYFDVGAMRFPDNPAMASTFALFDELDIAVGGGGGGALIPYVLGTDANYLLYNGIRHTRAEAAIPGDNFNDGVDAQGAVPEQYIALGVDNCLELAFEPFKVALAQDWDDGWNQLMQFDHLSTRAYLLQEMQYPWAVVQWMETRDTSTGAYDLAFSESVLDSLDFDYPGPPIDWLCIEGGTEVLTNAMGAALQNQPLYQHRVTSVSMTEPNNPATTMRLTVAGHPEVAEQEFSHVVSTVPFSSLRAIDLEACNLNYKQKMALRCLNYGPSTKVGIKFATRWWQHDPEPGQGAPFAAQMGGVSSTDRQSRVVVYPSYGMDDPMENPGVLIASYNWTQDSFRFGSLIQDTEWGVPLDPDREHPPSEEYLLDQIYKDLAALHGREPEWYRAQTLDYYAYDWYHNQYTMGAFGLFGPGQFTNLFTTITVPAAQGHLHFAGEAASYHHAWISGALDSAGRCVQEIEAQLD